MIIDLYIMRHGDAQPYASSDASRQLTPKGEVEVKHNALWLFKQHKSFDLMLISPYIRAQQTAKIVTQVMDESTRQETCQDLVPEGLPENVHDYLDAMIQLYHPKSVMLVSHMPLVSYLVEALSTDRLTPIFPTAGIAHIQYDVKQMKGHFNGVKAP